MEIPTKNNINGCFAPLPPHYIRGNSTACNNNKSSTVPAVEAYARDLMAFLKRYQRLHMASTEDFFTDIVAPAAAAAADSSGSSGEGGDSPSSCTTATSSASTIYRLCTAFEAEFVQKGDRLKDYVRLGHSSSSASSSSSMEGKEGGGEEEGSSSISTLMLTFEELANLIHNGPSRSTASASAGTTEGMAEAVSLRDFFNATEGLKLSRNYKQFKNPVQSTVVPLLSSSAALSCPPATAATETLSLEREEATSTKENEDNIVEIRSALLGKGMCVKKRHEVVQMEEAMRELIHLTAERQQNNNKKTPAMGCKTDNDNDNASISNTAAVEKVNLKEDNDRPSSHSGDSSSSCHQNGGDGNSLTVMNVGEGKGYVSRVISICSAVPVIGVDCNPLHKEVALGRLEPIMDVQKEQHREGGGGGNNSQSNHPSPSSSSSNANLKQQLNLNYCRRGHTTCVTCMVGVDTRWDEVLAASGVPTTVNNTAAAMSGNIISCKKNDDEQKKKSAAAIPTPPTTTGAVAADGASYSIHDRVQCRKCSKVFRTANPSLLLKHARQHYASSPSSSNATAAPSSDNTNATLGEYSSALPSEEEKECVAIDEWVATLRPDQLAAKVQSELYTPFIPNNHNNNRSSSNNNNNSSNGTASSSPPTARLLPKRERERSGACCSGEEDEGLPSTKRGGGAVGGDSGGPTTTINTPTTATTTTAMLQRAQDVLIDFNIVVTSDSDATTAVTDTSRDDDGADNITTANNRKDTDMSAVIGRTPPPISFQRRATILGYNEGGKKYKAFLHHNDKEEGGKKGSENGKMRRNVVSGTTLMLSLDIGAQQTITLNDSPIKKGGINSNNNGSSSKVTVEVTRVTAIPTLPLLSHPIATPSLSNVILMGLHTCGDLGAAICRLFRRDSRAPSMLLVSCCWRALTGDGFPMSRTLQRDGAIRLVAKGKSDGMATTITTTTNSSSPSCGTRDGNCGNVDCSSSSLWKKNNNDARLPSTCPCTTAAEEKEKGTKGIITYESLTIATQPIDAFTAASSSSDHYGASRLVFYRSLFKWLWVSRVAKDVAAIIVSGTPTAAAAAAASASGDGDDDEALTAQLTARQQMVAVVEDVIAAAMPNTSDRDFHRLVSRDKCQLTFAEYSARVMRYFTSSETLNPPPATVEQSGGGGANTTNNDDAISRRNTPERNNYILETIIKPAVAAACVVPHGTSAAMEAIDMATIAYNTHTYFDSNDDSPSSFRSAASVFQHAFATEKLYTRFVGFTTMRMWLSHLLEALLLVDRLLYVVGDGDDDDNTKRSDNADRIVASLVPLFDGALSPRLFAILAMRA